MSPPPINPTTHKRDDFGKLWYPPIVHELSPVDDDALEVLSKIPYVRLGWFTAQEALTYLDIFHRHLAPYCPAFTGEVEVGRSRYARIAQEPMLCTTILMTASRFFTLPGAGGLARCYLIHHRLWQQCERLIQLLIYGQEKHLRRNRTLGTIQSFLLLSEWHPQSLRSLFTSSQSDMWEGRDPRFPNKASSESREQSYPARYEKDLPDRANQSDRLLWIMVGTALNLAHEAGVFVDACNPDQAEGSEWLGPLRIRKLLYVYVTNLSVRLGFQNTFTQDIILTRAILPAEGFGRRGAENGDLSMDLWLGLVRLSRTASAMFFRTPSSTKAHLRNGDYIIFLQSFSVTLLKWYDDFVASQSEDFEFIQVITNGNIILQTTISMADNGRLRFIPIRQLQCIMSAFFFRFKAINICTRREDVETSLVVLERCVKALGEADLDEMDISRDTKAFLHSHVQRICDDVNVFFSALIDSDQDLGALVMADLGEPPAVDATTASQPFLLELNWNQEGFAVLGLPTDLTTPWSSLDTFSRLAAVDPPWQLTASPWDTSV
ncbi:hypothetical protein FoTM2_004790 [Fusarium oxysporum f. sp. vasinfectum]|nr:hypothetical protein FoTM2_004790 [Fusarium oxysporum f. sp. vasinfectum]